MMVDGSRRGNFRARRLRCVVQSARPPTSSRPASSARSAAARVVREGRGHPRRVVRFGLLAGRGARRTARTELAGRRLPRSGRAGARMVRLVARLRGRRARPCAVSQRHQPRADGRRAGPQDVEVARQLRRRRRRGRTGSAPTCCAWCTPRSTTPPTSRSADTIFTAVSESYRKIRNTCRYHARQSRRLRSGARRGRSLTTCSSSIASSWRALSNSRADVRRAYEAFEFQAAYQVMHELHRRRPELALYRRRARPALLRGRELARAPLGADRAVPCARRAGADARAADPVHRRRSLLAHAGRAARRACIC